MEVTVFLYVNCVKIYYFKGNNSEMKPFPLCLGNISKDFTVNEVKNWIKWIYI